MGETEFHSCRLLCNRAWLALVMRKHSCSANWAVLSIQGIGGNYNSDTGAGLFQFWECQITLDYLFDSRSYLCCSQERGIPAISIGLAVWYGLQR